MLVRYERRHQSSSLKKATKTEHFHSYHFDVGAASWIPISILSLHTYIATHNVGRWNFLAIAHQTYHLISLHAIDGVISHISPLGGAQSA